ncbi:MAG: rod shape-determining protein MreD [Acidimicrobiales bacterium]
MNPTTVARLRMAGLLALGILLQTTVAPDLRLGAVAPDFMLLLAICGGLAGGAETGAFVGFFAGLLTDLFLTTTPLGLAALTYCLVGYGIGFLRSTVLPEGWVLTPFMTALGTAAGVVAFVALGDVVGQSQLAAQGGSWILRVAAVETAFNVVLSLPVSRLFDRASRGSRGSQRLGIGRPDRVSVR